MGKREHICIVGESRNFFTISELSHIFLNGYYTETFRLIKILKNFHEYDGAEALHFVNMKEENYRIY